VQNACATQDRKSKKVSCQTRFPNARLSRDNNGPRAGWLRHLEIAAQQFKRRSAPYKSAFLIEWLLGGQTVNGIRMRPSRNLIRNASWRRFAKFAAKMFLT
jgi:hypothetical protein